MTSLSGTSLISGKAQPRQLFIAWTRYIRRPDSMQSYFGYELVFMKPPWEQRWLKPLGYLINSWKSLRMMIAVEPEVLWIQLAPPPLLYTASFYRALFNPNVRIVADCHNSAFQPLWFRWPLVRRLMNRCQAVHVHNASIMMKARKAGVSEPPLMCFLTPPCATDKSARSPRTPPPAYPHPWVLMACSFEFDEPLSTVFDAARHLPDVTFVITGETRRAVGHHDLDSAPGNVVFTGFVPVEALNALFEHADVVLALTLRTDCELSSANEGLGFGKAMVISDTPVLRELFPKGALYVDSANARDLARTLRDALARKGELGDRSKVLRAERIENWYRMADGFAERLGSPNRQPEITAVKTTRDSTDDSPAILYITTTLPALTVTFIYREIFALREKGRRVAMVSMNTPPQALVSEEAKPLAAETSYLDRVGLFSKMAAALGAALTHPVRFAHCLWAVIDPRGTPFPMGHVRLAYHLMEACYVYRKFGSANVAHVHCHFASGPASIGMFFHKLTETPFSFVMHGTNIFVAPIAMRRKLTEAAFGVAISEYNREHVLRKVGEDLRDRFRIIRCGISPSRVDLTREARDRAGRPVNLLGVGQLKERKGFRTLVEASRVLKQRGVAFHCTIVGEGPDKQKLEGLISRYELEDVVTLAGAVLQENIWKYYEDCDVFVLPCVIAADRDRDGIPVALMEAMSLAIPVVSSRIVGIPELIEHEKDGLLAEPNDSESLADAIQKLCESPAYRTRIGRAGAQKILRDFNLDTETGKLLEAISAAGAERFSSGKSIGSEVRSRGGRILGSRSG